MALIARTAERAREALLRFLALESAAGLILIAAAIVGLVCANSSLAPIYEHLLALSLPVKIGTFGIDKPLLLWINDGLMALFFLLVALELKREMIEGQFSDRSRIALPAVCALGGMVVPMAIYAAVNHGDAAAMRGVAIPAATDIAFALGVLALLGSRVPLALKLLLTAIAVLDDLGAILLIAIFYTSELSWLALGVAAASLVALVLLNRTGVTRLWAYFFFGAILWIAVLKSGVHATLAGVALGFTIPLRGRDGRQPLATLEHALHPWVAYAILPIFAFANAGVPLAGVTIDRLLDPVPLGIALGLVVGKPVGVLLFATAARTLRIARLPADVGFVAFAGMAILCGIGFTMSLFIGGLAFDPTDQAMVVGNRLGILAGSVVAAVLGAAVLFHGTRR